MSMHVDYSAMYKDYTTMYQESQRLESHPKIKIQNFLKPLQTIGAFNRFYTNLWTKDIFRFNIPSHALFNLSENAIIQDINEIINKTIPSNEEILSWQSIEHAKLSNDIHYLDDTYFITTILLNYQSALKLLFEIDNFDECFKKNNIYALSLIHKKLELFEFLVDIKKPNPVELQVSLVIAACHGLNDIVSYILSYGTNPNCLDSSALSIATLYGHISIINLLLGNGAKMNSINVPNEIISTTFPNDTFACAIYNNDVEIIKLYIDLGHDPHQTCELSLMVASKYNCLNILKFLIDYGLDYHHKNDIAFVMACVHDAVNVIVYLLDLGIDNPDTFGFALSCCCGFNNIRPIQFLLDHTQKIGLLESIINYNNGMPLKNVIKSLKQQMTMFSRPGTRSHYGYQIGGNGMYHSEIFETTIITKCTDIICLLVKYGVDLSHHLNKLYLIVLTGQKDLVKLFIEAGANIHHRELVLLLNTVSRSDVSIMEYLIECGIDIHLNSENALYLAYDKNNYRILGSSNRNHQPMIDCLISAGADTENPVIKQYLEDCTRKQESRKGHHLIHPKVDMSNSSADSENDIYGLFGIRNSDGDNVNHDIRVNDEIGSDDEWFDCVPMSPSDS